MNADDVEIAIERFIYEIQIRPEIWDLADWHKFGINVFWHKFIKRRYSHSSKQEKFIRICSQIGIKGDKQSFFTPIC